MYRDSAGLPTIGVGHLLTKSELSSGKISLPSGAVDWHVGLTDEQVVELFSHDLGTVEKVISTYVKVPLTQSQFDSLASFTFNVGTPALRTSTLLKKLNAGQYDQVPEQMRRWVYSAGLINPGLIKRREREVALWLA